MTDKWNDDLIQFARLLCEIQATSTLNTREIQESMDLDIVDIDELFERASIVWDEAKQEL